MSLNRNKWKLLWRLWTPWRLSVWHCIKLSYWASMHWKQTSCQSLNVRAETLLYSLHNDIKLMWLTVCVLQSDGNCGTVTGEMQWNTQCGYFNSKPRNGKFYNYTAAQHVEFNGGVILSCWTLHLKGRLNEALGWRGGGGGGNLWVHSLAEESEIRGSNKAHISIAFQFVFITELKLN